MIKQKIKYFVRCLLNFNQEKVCPFCSGKSFIVVEKKYLITSLLKCTNCGLSHRHPQDTKEFLAKFYQKDYQVDVEMMTDLPSDIELEKLKQSNFDSLKSYLPIIESVFKKSEIKMVDYGCSWGYNVYKLRKENVDAVGFELSVPRAEFGKKKLGVGIATTEEDIRDDNDLIFSSHVIEHLYAIQDFVALSKQKLRPEGVFMAFCPNGSKEYQMRQPEIFRVTWGTLHPNYLDIDFASFVFKDNPYFITTSDWPYNLEKISQWDGLSQYIDDYKEGYELLIIAKPNIKI